MPDAEGLAFEHYISIPDGNSTYTSSYTIDIPAGATDDGSLCFIVDDQNGNRAQEFTRFEIIDNTPPTVIVDGLTGGQSLDIGELTSVALDAQDNVGITNVELYYSTTDNPLYISNHSS